MDVREHLAGFKARLKKRDLITPLPFGNIARILLDIKENPYLYDGKERNVLVLCSCLTDSFGKHLAIELSILTPHLIPFTIPMYVISHLVDEGFTDSVTVMKNDA